MPPIETGAYYGLVAQDLFARFGSESYVLAEQALARMKQLGDPEGHMMWRGIKAALREFVGRSGLSEGATLH